MAYGHAQELAVFVRHLQEAARPAPRIAGDLGIGQVPDDANACSRAAERFNNSTPSSSGTVRSPKLRWKKKPRPRVRSTR
jgi:hypothetical protein